MNLDAIERAATFLLACALKATLLFGAAWIAAALARRRSSAFRHFIWSIAILASLALPLLTRSLPAWRSSALASAASLWSPAHAASTATNLNDLPAMIVRAATSAPVILKWSSVVLLAWASGFLFLALRILIGLTRLGQLSASAKQLLASEWTSTTLELAHSLKIKRPLRLLESGDPAWMPLTWGTFRPVLFVPSGVADWPAARRRMVICHELAHIARYDWLFQSCAELARAVYWFQPLVWVAARLLRQESEHACDDAVLQSGISAPDYADQLLSLAAKT